MARLPRGEKQHRENMISRVLRRCRYGLTEQDIAAETGLDRRTVNNYLRSLNRQEHAYKDGKYWYPED